jgi:hypothetical protein
MQIACAQPRLVAQNVEGKVSQAGVLGGAELVFDPGVLAVAGIE